MTSEIGIACTRRAPSESIVAARPAPAERIAAMPFQAATAAALVAPLPMAGPGC